MGIMTPWSFVPHIALPYKDRMNFWERCHNVFVSVVDLIGRRWYYLPEQQKLAEKYFKDVPGKCSNIQCESKAIFINLFKKFSRPSALFVEVGKECIFDVNQQSYQHRRPQTSDARTSRCWWDTYKTNKASAEKYQGLQSLS